MGALKHQFFREGQPQVFNRIYSHRQGNHVVVEDVRKVSCYNYYLLIIRPVNFVKNLLGLIY